MAYQKTKPYTFHRDEGPRLQSLGALIYLKATSEQTGSQFNLLDVTCPPGYATPLHIHYAEDVALYVLEGVLTVVWGGEKRKATAGSYFFQPRGTPHGFRVEGPAPARVLYMTSPAGLDRFVAEQEQLTPCAETELASARYKIEILGPLPE